MAIGDFPGLPNTVFPNPYIYTPCATCGRPHKQTEMVNGSCIGCRSTDPNRSRINSRQITDRLVAKGITAVKSPIQDWELSHLSRFCEVGHEMLKKQLRARFNVTSASITEADAKQLIKEVMEEVEIVTENLICLALDNGYMKVKNLKKRPTEAKAKNRSLIVAEEEDSE